MRAVIVLIIAVGVCGAVAGCDGGPSAEKGKTTATSPAPVAPVSPPATRPAGDDPAAAQLVRTRCAQCHTLERVEAHHYSRAGWETIIARMAQNGMTATAEERTAIINYLATRDANVPHERP